MKASFNTRARVFITSILNQRDHLIRSGKNPQYNEQLRYLCETIRGNLTLLQSDHSMARYFIKSSTDLITLMPFTNNALSPRMKKMHLLLNEANEIIQKQKISA